MGNNIAPMLGAIMGISKTPRGQDKKRAGKPKTHSGVQKRDHRVTKGEHSVTESPQQHGELASYKEPKPISHTQQIKLAAKGSMRRATDDWVEGRVSTKEHNAVHARGKHVLSGKNPREYSGTSGERRMKSLKLR